MSALRRFGFFRDLRHGSPDEPALATLVQSAPQQNEDRIISYLRDGLVLIATPGLVTDALQPGSPICSPHVITDGVWAWPNDLAYYVQKYHVRLPDDFIA